MKTLQEIKDEYAIHLASTFKRNFSSWEEMENTDFNYGTGISKNYSLVQLMEEVSKRFAVEVSKESLSNAYESTKDTLQEFAFKREGVLSKYLSEAIESNKNIPKL